MREVVCVQGTPEWLTARIGMITASRMADVMAKPKRSTAELACRRDYRMELVCERLTGRAAEHYVSRDMELGTENEPFARAAYEVAENVLVDEVGMVIHPTLDYAGASPDGLVSDDGAIEIKAPKTATHIDWRISNVVPAEHTFQMFWVMACCQREYCDFVSFDPRLPPGLRFFVKRLEREEKIIAEMEYAAMEFNAEIEAMCEKLCPGFKWVPKMPQARLSAPERTEDFIGDLMAAMDGADSTEGNMIP